MITVDSHAHIFERNLPIVHSPRYLPGHDATLEEYLGYLDANGISHGVLVQPSFLGSDNSYLLAALGRKPQRLRGVAVVDPEVSEDELSRMADSGVVGIRLNLIGQPLPDMRADPWPRLLRMLTALNFHVEIHRQAGDLAQLLDPLLSASGVNVVVDHFGRPDPALGVDDPGFRYLLSCAASRRVWVKVAASYRNGPDGRGAAIALAAMPLLRKTFGLERLVWGSDWPHSQFEATESIQAAKARLEEWLPSSADQAIVLGETPVHLFHFA
ncbi:Predicted metal-dependent hydrolase, TIM-barrel fold [Pollutimonas bauzanensis]|uniref:Predicted metal-dependent hydrolase, TIM-barrel fold n=1 Tax=Pollutimonas bauzanensis TaxID=658167 RepID=A0A1M5ZC42_9BURK|nr:amidohydrolase family protein [Pollutimonas bauzanensis]SHI21483.1 Predicted metal-dependent hydrolase, TIM-barrel fold [Pollutimonas bauzanensis]